VCLRFLVAQQDHEQKYEKIRKMKYPYTPPPPPDEKNMSTLLEQSLNGPGSPKLTTLPLPLKKEKKRPVLENVINIF